MLISVTIPVFNDNLGLKRSLESLLLQSYIEWEALVVDDGSLESAESVILEFNDPRIKFYRWEINQGRPAARQKTFQMMTGTLCAFLDAGDYYEPHYLENAVNEFKKSDVVAVSQSMVIKYKDLQFLHTYEDGIYNLHSEYFNKIAFASTVFYSALCKNYNFNMSLKYSQDKHFLNFIAANNVGKFCMLNTSAYIYDQGSNMRISTTIKKYYYSVRRLFSQKKYFEGLKTIIKGTFLSLLHIFFGYERLLSIRFKKK